MATESKPTKTPAAKKPAAPKKPAAAKASATPRVKKTAAEPTSPSIEKVTIMDTNEPNNLDTSQPKKFDTAAIKEQASDKLRSAATTTKDKAVDAAGSLSKIVDDAATKIDENFGAQYGDYARTAAKSIDEFAAKVDAKDVDQIADDTREFVKKRPAIAIGAAAAIGFAIIRLFKSGGKKDV